MCVCFYWSSGVDQLISWLSADPSDLHIKSVCDCISWKCYFTVCIVARIVCLKILQTASKNESWSNRNLLTDANLLHMVSGRDVESTGGFAHNSITVRRWLAQALVFSYPFFKGIVHQNWKLSGTSFMHPYASVISAVTVASFYPCSGNGPINRCGAVLGKYRLFIYISIYIIHIYMI